MNKRFGVVYFLVLTVLSFAFSISAQNEFAATLEVLSTGVEVQRVNTANFIAVEFEAIVGVGDVIRTDETGEARITFFADGTDVVLEPGTEYRIIEFSGDDNDFQLRVEIVIGQAVHRLSRSVGTNSSYDVETPGMTLAAQGTVFAIRVEDNGRSGMLVSEGIVDAEAGESSANVPAEFGVRSATDSDLSDVVRASTFDELDSALDGCTPDISTPDDLSINVRSGPSLDNPQLGYVSASSIETFFGVNEEGNWYRIEFAGYYGWILSSSASIEGNCAGLRVFETSYSEDLSLYEGLDIEIDESAAGDTEEPVAEVTEEATDDQG